MVWHQAQVPPSWLFPSQGLDLKEALTFGKIYLRRLSFPLLRWHVSILGSY